MNNIAKFINKYEKSNQCDDKPRIFCHENIKFYENVSSIEDFYDEHWDVLEESESMIFLQGCNMKDNIALTSFALFRHNSKNKYYYKIKSNGEFADLIDTDEYFDVLDHQDDDSTIVYFKDVCNNSYDLDGELDDEDLNSSSIEFYD